MQTEYRGLGSVKIKIKQNRICVKVRKLIRKYLHSSELWSSLVVGAVILQEDTLYCVLRSALCRWWTMVGLGKANSAGDWLGFF